MTWQFTLNVCLKILTPWLEVKLRSFPRPELSGGYSMYAVGRMVRPHPFELTAGKISLQGSSNLPQSVMRGCEHARPHLWCLSVSHHWLLLLCLLRPVTLQKKRTHTSFVTPSKTCQPWTIRSITYLCSRYVGETEVSHSPVSCSSDRL